MLQQAKVKTHHSKSPVQAMFMKKVSIKREELLLDKLTEEAKQDAAVRNLVLA